MDAAAKEALSREMTYYVTRETQAGGQYFVHSEFCAVLPPDDTLETVGVFADSGEALEAAREGRDPVNACATCSPECHVPDHAGGARAFDTRDAALKRDGV